MYCALAAAAVVVSQILGAAAHGGVLSYSIGSTWYKGFSPYNSATGQVTIQREWDTYNPIQDVTSANLSCNDGGGALPSGQQLTATIAAGQSITAYWNVPWPHNTGPVLTYLAACPSSGCNSFNSQTAQWFKIQEAGLISGSIYNGTWAAGEMIANNNSWTTTIPSTVPSGFYLIRFETIALHSMPAQNYPECAQIQITGGGNVAPPSSILVTFPGGYSQTDPGLDIDIYSNAAETTTNYTIPGPPLYPGTGSSSSGGGAPKSSTAPVQSSTAPVQSSTKPVQSTTAPVASSTPTGATVAKYGQCGGQGYTGPTVCAAGSTCTVTNQYYSQCL